MACHNYLIYNQIPPGTVDLLGLGLNYCITSHTIDTTIKTFDRFREDARRKYYFYKNPPEEKVDQYGPSYIPSLYIKSDYEFLPANYEIEEAIHAFESAVKAAQQQSTPRRTFHPNLTHAKWKLL